MTLQEAVQVFDRVFPLDLDMLTVEGEQVGIPYCCELPVVLDSHEGTAPKIYCAECRRTITQVAKQWMITNWGLKGIKLPLPNGSFSGAGRLPPDADPLAQAPKTDETAELRAALQKSVELIHTWHNMTHCGPPANLRAAKLMEEAWEIYKAHAPEMQLIMRALGGEK